MQNFPDPSAAAHAVRVAPGGWWVVYGSIVAVLMSVMDLQMTNTAIEQIQTAMQAPLASASWLTSGYLLGESMMLPLSGLVVARLGLQRYGQYFCLLFLAASILCAQATGMPTLIAWRVLQGIASGALIPFPYMLIIERLPRDDHAKAFTLFGATMALAPTLGPSAGGALSALLGWQALFYVNLPVGLVALLMMRTGLRNHVHAGGRQSPVDWVSLVSIAIGLGCVQFVLEEGNARLWFESTLIVALCGIGLLMLAAFLVNEMCSTHPLFDLTLFGNRRFTFACASNALACAATFGSYFLIPYFLVTVHDYSPVQISRVIMITGATQLVVLWLTPALLRRLDLYLVIGAGAFSFAAGTFTWSELTSSYVTYGVVAAQISRGIGLSFMLAPLCIAATTTVEPSQAASASILFNISRSLGGAFGVALFVALAQSRRDLHESGLSSALGTLKPADALMSGAFHRASYVRGIGDTFTLMSCAILAVGVLFCTAWLMDRRHAAGHAVNAPEH